MDYITEPERKIPIAGHFDLCVVGGSCTGVFAAVRAARLGLRVAVVEQHTILGGMATAGQVTHWHSTFDVAGERKIIGGLLDEMVERLKRRSAVTEIDPIDRVQYKFNAAMLACELDSLAVDNGVTLFLSSRFSTPFMDGNRVTAIVVEDKSGRRAISASMFIDASEDGDLVRRAEFEAIQHSPLQATSYQILADGLEQIQREHLTLRIWDEVQSLRIEFGFPMSNPWIDIVPGNPHVSNVFGARVFDFDASDADDLTQAYLNGRRIAVAFLDMIRKRFPGHASDVSLVSLAHCIGVRETWHACCLHRTTMDELLSGHHFEDAIANGIYPLDVHAPEGTALYYLDGRKSFRKPGKQLEWSRWRDDAKPTPSCYHIPYKSLVPKGSLNLLVAGRLVDAEREAYGGTRVMVNCNQTGEAAGVACALALDKEIPVAEVATARLRRTLSEGGSIVI